ncbi:hypothetical protein N7488_000752 [Penicillium malachiteum]|nr:hypothetical protein N7488_000752 [Penicillium malachiteum]
MSMVFNVVKERAPGVRAAATLGPHSGGVWPTVRQGSLELSFPAITGVNIGLLKRWLGLSAAKSNVPLLSRMKIVYKPYTT